MANNRLYNLLLEHQALDRETLDRLVAELDDPNDSEGLKNLVLRDSHLSFYELMDLALTRHLFPRAQAILKRLAKAREHHQVIKPTRHTTRYKLYDDETPAETFKLPGTDLKIPLPKPNLSRYQQSGTDERQVVEMAVDLIRIHQYQEAEMFLIDARDEFNGSPRVNVLLVWLYLLCDHFADAHVIVADALSNSPGDPLLIEYAGLIDQCLGKHLTAINHYQKLVLLPEPKPIWYLLLADSLEHARLTMEAGANYRHYLSLGPDAPLRTHAEQRLNHLVN